MSQLNSTWIPIITKEYLKYTAPGVDITEFADSISDIEKLVAASLDNSDRKWDAHSQSPMPKDRMAKHLFGDTGLLGSINELDIPELSTPEDGKLPAESFLGVLDKKIKWEEEVPEGALTKLMEVEEKAIAAAAEVAAGETLTEDLVSIDSYVEASARENELVVVPELFRQGQTLRNLYDKGWIRKIVPKTEDNKITDSAFSNFQVQSQVVGEEPTDAAVAGAKIEGYDRSFSGGVSYDEGAYWVFTDQATDGFNDWLGTVFTADELYKFYEANTIDPDSPSYKNLIAMRDLISSNFTFSDRAELIYNLTGDETISPENAFLKLDNGMLVAEDDIKLVGDATQFGRSQLKRLANIVSKGSAGLDSSNLPWQIIALAIEQADDYRDDDDPGTPITENVNSAINKFSKYDKAYDEALNIYTDGQGTTYHELAYLHLLSPDLAQKIMNGGHDQLTVGEINFINSSFSTIDNFHARTGQFSPGWSTNMSTKDWLQGLSPGRMTESYLTEAQVDSLAQQGIYQTAGEEEQTREKDDLSQLDETKKAVAEKTYSDLYKQWFMDDPTTNELERFMSWHASKEANYRRESATWSPYETGQYNNPNDTTDATLLSQRTALNVEGALRDDPKYAQLYGRKPTGMTETEYGQVFSAQAMADYGQSGALNTGRLKRGMETGDPSTITREGILTGEGYDNSQYMGKIMNLRNAFRRNT